MIIIIIIIIIIMIMMILSVLARGRAVGCILYELFVGTPPFYTNSIFQLVSMIIKDPVKWPKNMSPVFKDFLQGLLNKNPHQRLSWPDLLHHPFIVSAIKGLALAHLFVIFFLFLSSNS